MDQPVSLQLTCPHCGDTNSVPGFAYGPNEELVCFNCGDLFRVGQSRVNQVVRDPRVIRARQLGGDARPLTA